MDLLNVNSVETRCLSTDRFPNRHLLDKKTFQTLYERLRDTGSSKKRVSNGNYWNTLTNNKVNKLNVNITHFSRNLYHCFRPIEVGLTRYETLCIFGKNHLEDGLLFKMSVIWQNCAIAYFLLFVFLKTKKGSVGGGKQSTIFSSLSKISRVEWSHGLRILFMSTKPDFAQLRECCTLDLFTSNARSRLQAN